MAQEFYESPIDSSIQLTQHLLDTKPNYDATYTDIVGWLEASAAYNAAAAAMPKSTDLEELRWLAGLMFLAGSNSVKQAVTL